MVLLSEMWSEIQLILIVAEEKLFFCENCCKDKHKHCFNRHLYYQGELCTCLCNWPPTNEEIMEILAE